MDETNNTGAPVQNPVSQPQNPNPVVPNMGNVYNTTPPVVEKGGSSLAPIIAVIVILAAIIFGVLYFTRTTSPAPVENTLEAQGGTDSAADIEADLNSTNVENVDFDLDESNFTAS